MTFVGSENSRFLVNRKTGTDSIFSGDVLRSPSAVLREEHEKLKSRPSSFVQDRGPVLRKIGRARSRIEPLRDDICGLRKFSFSRERSELSKSLVAFFRSYQQPTTSNVQRFSRAHAPPQAVPPARAGIKIKSGGDEEPGMDFGV